ncbi:metallophosphoesterase family protein [Numidum massiliense]|uniref:metallophosphoesterase family protein n=1 Tax=Numidum massiliense TaxID=1522315 RepID=UPI0006D5648C|nr:metallophosphoesterase [Numidum massiliense]
MTSFRFIHAADLHLDSPCKGIGQRLPEMARRRLQEATFTACERLVQLCIEERVDFLCIAGDVYDLADRSLRAQTFFQKKMRELAAHGIHVYVCHGNHDPADGGQIPLTWPDNVHFFSTEEVEAVPFIKGGREVARVYGRSYPTAKFTERIVQDYVREPDVPFAIGVLHTNLDGDQAHDNYAPSTRHELFAQGFDYWALGHIHKRAVVHAGDPYIVYAGNTQGRSVKESGAKGCTLVDVSDGHIDRVAFCATDDVRMFSPEVDLTDVNDMQQGIDLILESLQKSARCAEGRAAVVRLYLTGRTDLHSALKPADSLLELLDPYLEDFMLQEDWLCVESVVVRTQPVISRETLLSEDSFLGDFLRLVEQAESSAEQLESLKKDVLNDVFMHREARKHLEQLTEDETKRLLQEAKDLTLQLFLK